MKTKRKLVVLLDAHAILHRSFHAMSHFSTRDGRPTGALYGYIAMVLRLRELFHPDYILSCFDLPKPTFRHLVYDDYKAGRSETPDALKLQIQEAMRVSQAMSVPVYSAEGFEADDIIGTLSVELTKRDDYDVIIASGDMDTMQLVRDERVRVFTMRKGSETMLFDEDAVRAKFSFGPDQIRDYKALAGDSSDNIVGVPGIGDKTATELIVKFGSVEKLYEALKKDTAAVKAAGVKDRTITLLTENEEEAFFSKTLATIRKDAPVTFEEPKSRWEDSLDDTKFEAICDEFEFVALRKKLQALHGVSTAKKVGEVEEKEEHVVESVINENNRALYYDTQVLLNLLESEMTNPSLEAILDYTKCGTLTEARETLMEKVREEGFETLYREVEAPVAVIIDQMEKVGIRVDVKALGELSETLHKRVKELEELIYKEAGEVFTINSPKQLGVILYEKLNLGEKVKKTKTGAKTTNAAQLESMKDEHPIIAFLLEYRELTKLLSTYIDTLPNYVRDDGKIHAHFVQTGAGTGRFSCEEPNLQNLPVKSELGKLVRQAFVASEGKVLVSCDYSQIDLRSAAIMSQDSHLVEIFMRGIDVHTGTAAKMFHVAEDEVTPEMRRKAKVINFGILYGMGVNALKDGMDVSRKEAQEFYDAYKMTFVRLSEYLEEVKAYAWKHGYTRTLLGRRRKVPLLKSPLPHLRAHGERMAINAPMQGTSADILKLGMIDAARCITQKYHGKAETLLQIHDELVFEVEESYGEAFATEIKKVMEGVLLRRGLSNLPLSVTTGTGKHLNEV